MRVELAFRAFSRGRSPSRARSAAILAQPPHIVGQRLRCRREQAGASCSMMSRVPPVSIAAIGTPSALASISTRLSDSGPRDGKISIDACASQSRGVASIQPAQKSDRAADAAPRAPASAPIRAVAANTSGQSRSARSTTSSRCGCPCSVRACRGRAHTDSSSRAARLALAIARSAGDVHRVGDHLERVAAARARAREVGGDLSADGDHRVGAREPCAWSRGSRACTESSAAPAARARRRAAGCTRVMLPTVHSGQSATPSAVCNQIRPVADRPVVAHRGDDRHVRVPVPRRIAGSVVITCCAWTMSKRCRCEQRRQSSSPSDPRQPLVLEVVAHVRHVGRRRAELDAREAVVRRFANAGGVRRAAAGRS